MNTFGGLKSSFLSTQHIFFYDHRRHLSPKNKPKQRTYPRVYVQDLSTGGAHEAEAMAGLINHLKVGAGVGRGHLSFPVVKTAEKRKQLLDDSLSITATD